MHIALFTCIDSNPPAAVTQPTRHTTCPRSMGCGGKCNSWTSAGALEELGASICSKSSQTMWVTCELTEVTPVALMSSISYPKEAASFLSSRPHCSNPPTTKCTRTPCSDVQPPCMCYIPLCGRTLIWIDVNKRCRFSVPSLLGNNNRKRKWNL